MSKRYLASIVLFCVFFLSNLSPLFANEPDSAYIFAFSTTKNSGKNGLHLAWSIDKKNWHAIGNEHRFLGCDYGTWGNQKKMFSPFLFQDNTQKWHCLWSVNNDDATFALASSSDLVNWKPQFYPSAEVGTNCLDLEVIFDTEQQNYSITWVSNAEKDTTYSSLTTSDFKSFGTVKPFLKQNRVNLRTQVVIAENQETGTIHKVAWHVIDDLIQQYKKTKFEKQLTNESYQNDSTRFKDLKMVEVNITADTSNTKEISDLLMGVFFEDINYAADGGLYAELVQNRGFEYDLHDKKGRDKTWTHKKAWSINDSSATLTIDTVAPIHPNTKHYAVLKTSKQGTALINKGFGGIAIKEGEKYNFSAFVKSEEKGSTKLLIRLSDEAGNILGEGSIKANSSGWKKANTVITANKTEANAQLEIIPQSDGTLAFDMISLFPQNTFKGRENGMRADLAEAIEDLQPRFIRFPGGCVAHGDGIENIYNWKNTIGPIESRKPQRNLWHYHQSFGLGYYEYFQLCEDLGAVPVPVIAAGVPCQNSSNGGAGQQCGVPLSEMDDYIKDILDLIEYCNGDKKSTWGKKRAEAGHPKPFNLKYIGIGNEDLISEIFKERFELIYKAINEKYPEITVIGTVGPFHNGSDYEEGWSFASQLNIPIVDEHYYEQPGWFINNQNYYDKYDRSKSRVYLGEYASWGNRFYNALAEAIYLTGVERNGDIVTMASYAPLLAKEGNTQWRTDMIFFNNTELKPTPNYEVQKLYGQNSGDTYVGSKVQISSANDKVKKRIGVSIVTDSKTGDIIIKLANLLPVKTQISLDLTDLISEETIATKTTLTGNPSARKVEPITEDLKISGDSDLSLPPYSFAVIRCKKSISKQ